MKPTGLRESFVSFVLAAGALGGGCHGDLRPAAEAEVEVEGGPLVCGAVHSVNVTDVHPGDEIVIEGRDFSPTLAENEVTIGDIPAAPLRVEFPSNGDPDDGLESRLRVLVPTGVKSGRLRLRVKGLPADGGADLLGSPQLMSFAIGRSGREPSLVHSGFLGFSPLGGSIQLTLFGLNLEEVDAVIMTDRSGAQSRIPRIQFLEWPIPDLPANGLSRIQFSLENASLAISLSTRDELLIDTKSRFDPSNGLRVPVVPITALSTPLGPVINGILVPPGVRTGPIRLRYSMYDHPQVDQAFVIDVRWSADGGKTFFPAVPDLDDPEHDGTRQVLPGDIDFGSAAGLFFAGGALRTFTWDPVRDSELQKLRGSGVGAGALTLRFRIQLIPEFVVTGKPSGTRIAIDSPPVAFLDLGPAGTPSAAIEGANEFIEDFTTTHRADAARTTALWNIPEAPGFLRAALPSDAALPNGRGTFELSLQSALPPQPAGTEVFYLVDTTRLAITNVVVVGGEVSTVEVFPTAGSSNPGEAAGEFHVGTFTIGAEVEVRCEGSRPAVFRVSGNGLGPDAVTVNFEGQLSANGRAGGAPRVDEPGPGGRGGCGGGAGARLFLDGERHVTRLDAASGGGNDGGRGGATPGAVDSNPAVPSRFLGAPGGGGGHRFAGGTGDPGPARSPSNFASPRGGRGGPSRGSPSLVPLTVGSGGGGGGATISRAANSIAGAALPGAGGGEGGGAIQITASGSMVIRGVIDANGGPGGDGRNSGAGGGGSGGAIFLQATGSIDIECDSLRASGGAAGFSSSQNQRLGAGAGSRGRIRVEPGAGGVPLCLQLAHEAKLAARLSVAVAPTTIAHVTDGLQFPPEGVVRIDDEFIAYHRVFTSQGSPFGQLGALERGFRGTGIAVHESGARVVLETPVSPPEGLVKAAGPVHESPDAIAAGDGRDGTFHAFFMESLEPETGDPLTDPTTGERISVWTIDTDRGILARPDGTTANETKGAAGDHGIFSLTMLRIDPRVVVRGFGSRPLRLFVAGETEIAGALDLSGTSGGLLDFDEKAPGAPSPGAGGFASAGGGAGGAGGSIDFADGNVENKTAENISVRSASRGGLPPLFPPELDRTGSTSGTQPPPADLTGLETTRPTGGDSLVGGRPECGTSAKPCTAGGGGGGGARSSGRDGQALPAGGTAFGRGGSPLGLDTFRFEGEFALFGGQGGAGGGASAHVSPEYAAGQTGSALFRGAAKFAPGTGGGGSGGAIHIVAGGAIVLRSSGSIVARGGDAFQSIDAAGNGGAGGGGAVLIQAAGVLSIEPGARIDVAGGKANLPVPVARGFSLPIHEGNVRAAAGASTAAFGGLGGDGAPGRVRIEAPGGSSLLRSALSGGFSSAEFLPDAVVSAGISQAIRLADWRRGGTLGHSYRLETPIIRYAASGFPPRTRVHVLWKGAAASLDVHGARGPFRGGVEDPRELQDLDAIQFEAYLTADAAGPATPALDAIVLPFGGAPRGSP